MQPNFEYEPGHRHSLQPGQDWGIAQGAGMLFDVLLSTNSDQFTLCGCRVIQR